MTKLTNDREIYEFVRKQALKSHCQDRKVGCVITDENGQVIYDQQGIETSDFEIEISSKVTVKISGEEHKGSFSLSW